MGGFGPLEDLWLVLWPWSGFGLLPMEEDLLRQLDLVDWYFLPQKGGGEPSNVLVWLSLPQKGLGVWPSLHKAFHHGHIVSGCRGGLSHQGLQASPKQTLVAEGDGIGLFHQHPSLVALGTGSHPEGLCPEGVESTVDCLGPRINHGYTSVLGTSTGKRSCLDVFPGRLEGFV